MIRSTGRNIIYTVEDVMEGIHCGNQKAIKLIAELEKKAGLMKKKCQGLGKSSLIYVLKFVQSTLADTSKLLEILLLHVAINQQLEQLLVRNCRNIYLSL